MKKILPLLLVFASLQASAQTYVSVEEQDLRLADLIAFFIGRPLEFDVRNYKVTYNTTDVFGEPTVASGLLCLPTDRTQAYPLGIYNHGTVVNREAVPSRVATTERLLPQGMAASGIITVAPDYLGLGDHPGIHPYVHADSEASAGRDLLLAARQWLDEQEIDYTDQLFLTGYSQGGHATQALHRDLQTNPGEDNLVVTGATHLSGPYSISDVMRQTLFQEGQATLPGYIIYTYIAYDFVYDLFDEFDDAFAPPYVGNVDSFARGLIDLGTFNTRLEAQIAENNASLGDLLTEDIRTQLMEGDTSSIVMQALLDNDTYDWAPEAPTLMIYCTEDEQVPFQNALLADSVMRANGSTSVTLVNGGPETHGGCISPAVNQSLDFFLSLITTTSTTFGEVIEAGDIRISPNPVSAGTEILINGLNAEAHDYVIYDQSGRETARGKTDSSGRITLGNRVSSGLQVIRIQLPSGQSVVRRLLVK